MMCLMRKLHAVRRSRLIRLGLLMAAGLLAGCASSPKQEPTVNAGQPPALARMPSRGEPATVFEQPLAKTRQAALDALVVVGCKIKKQEPTYVDGRRPNKMGLFVGSGGETLKIWLEEVGPTKTSVRVKTSKSLIGIVGQKDWDTEVLMQMHTALLL